VVAGREAGVVLGEPHGPQLPASIRQAKVDPASLEVKPNEAVVAVVVPLGPAAIVVSGGVVSRRRCLVLRLIRWAIAPARAVTGRQSRVQAPQEAKRWAGLQLRPPGAALD
jgi:hypothetical protein